jgi:hypothetical protein
VDLFPIQELRPQEAHPDDAPGGETTPAGVVEERDTQKQGAHDEHRGGQEPKADIAHAVAAERDEEQR